MTAKIIDGKKVAEIIKSNLKKKIEDQNLKPGLAVVQVGHNPASTTYVNLKEKACKEIGITSFIHRFDSISEKELMELVSKLNNDPSVNGILVQLPLPEGIDSQKVLLSIKPEKDVDGFHPYNVGCMFVGMDALEPCTPRGVMRLLDEYGINPTGKNAVVVGRSNIVGKPLSMMLLSRNATVTVCHRKTKDLKSFTINADILVAAAGKPGLITADMVKEGAVVIDVGTTRIDGKLTGDVDFEKVREVAGFITPVPGGVGPMTIATLMETTVSAAIKQGCNK